MPELPERRAMQKKIQSLLQRQVDEVVFPVHYGKNLIVPKNPPFCLPKDCLLVAIDGCGTQMCLQFQCSEEQNASKYS